MTASDGPLSNTSNVTITGNPPTPSNQAPAVNAGSAQTITLPSSSSVSGTATDDGLPSGTLTKTWSKYSGPGTVTFGNASALSTTASFSTSGSYVLRLTASDGSLSSTSDLTITVNPSASLGANYYVDSVGGSDSNSGTSDTSPWKTLTPVHNKTFQPGDTVHFKRGGSWGRW